MFSFRGKRKKKMFGVPTRVEFAERLREWSKSKPGATQQLNSVVTKRRLSLSFSQRATRSRPIANTNLGAFDRTDRLLLSCKQPPRNKFIIAENEPHWAFQAHTKAIGGGRQLIKLSVRRWRPTLLARPTSFILLLAQNDRGTGFFLVPFPFQSLKWTSSYKYPAAYWKRVECVLVSFSFSSPSSSCSVVVVVVDIYTVHVSRLSTMCVGKRRVLSEEVGDIAGDVAQLKQW